MTIEELEKSIDEQNNLIMVMKLSIEESKKAVEKANEELERVLTTVS